jgi:hypothetical protein
MWYLFADLGRGSFALDTQTVSYLLLHQVIAAISRLMSVLAAIHGSQQYRK